MSAALVVANWKMHGGQTSAAILAKQIVGAAEIASPAVEVVLAPPFTALFPVRQNVQNSAVKMAAQNSHWEDSGAFTGEISAAMLAEAGCEFIIVGHSERRQIFHESDELVGQKLGAVLRHRMRPILCVGETLEERRAQQTATIVAHQLEGALKGIGKDDIEHVEIAYEPVWAIGTGQNATAEQIRETHAQIRNFLIDRFGRTKGRQTRIVYGGSVKPENAAMLAGIDQVNGVLVGGASLAAESFLPIVKAFSNYSR